MSVHLLSKRSFIVVVQQANMSTENLLACQFSPFYKVRKLLLVLRWCLGFPLKFKDGTYSVMYFSPCLEYGRYFAFLTCFIVSISFIIFEVWKLNDLKSFLEAYHHYFRSIGFTAYDSIAFHTTYYMSILSTTFYLLAFRNNVSSINKICLRLTTVKKSLHQLMVQNRISKNKSRCVNSIRQIISGIMITVLVHASQVVGTYTLDYRVLTTSTTSKIEKFLISMALIICHLCWTYPSIAMSADFVTCHLLNEIENCFKNWNNIFKRIGRKSSNSTQCNGEGTQEEAASKIIERYL